MKKRQHFDINRREFLITGLGAGAGLTLGLYLSGCERNAEKLTDAQSDSPVDTGRGETLFEPNSFVRITNDDKVIVIIKHLEMGQGTYTGLATLVAEELDADWSQIVSEGAPADTSRYNNLFWGQTQGTGGSTAMANSFTQMRKAGATARHMLIAAAAEQWHADSNDLVIKKGVIKDPASGRQARFGELADQAAQQPIPDEVFVKDPDEFTLIGTHVPRKDSREKINGSAPYIQDIQLPDMLVAMVAHPPRFGVRVKSYNAEQTRKVRGVREVVEIPNGVAVLAEHTWTAIKGREALSIEWDERNAFNMSSDALLADYKQRAQKPGNIAHQSGDSGKALDTRKPVKMVWTREDDTRAGYFRPLYYHTLSAALDATGKPVAWQHRIVGQSIMTGTALEADMVKDGVDASSVEGAAELPYTIANITVDLHSPDLPVPVQWWRSVGSTHTAFAVETMIDQLARRAGQDPVEFRRRLLDDHPRHLDVLNLAAEKAGWGTALPEGRARGIALHKSFNSYVAQVAEVSLQESNRFTVERVVIAVDCGIAVNPDVIRAQMEGGMGFGLSAALISEITLDQGAVAQSNYHDFQMISIDQMPEVEVHIVKSNQPPTGVGEPATPVIAPAVANALTALTGQSFQRLPLKLSA